MKINVVQISEDEGLRIHHLFPDGEPHCEGSDLRLEGRTEVNAQAERSGEKVQLVGSIAATASFVCDRCLKPISIRVDPKFDLLYIPPLGSEEEKELVSDDLSIGFYQDHVIDLDALIIEQIELALPMSRLCREECRGLCPGCGASLNEVECGCSRDAGDPRWAALSKFRVKQ
jgi:DUF177 domain-containing protein